MKVIVGFSILLSDAIHHTPHTSHGHALCYRRDKIPTNATGVAVVDATESDTTHGSEISLLHHMLPAVLVRDCDIATLK